MAKSVYAFVAILAALATSICNAASANSQPNGNPPATKLAIRFIVSSLFAATMLLAPAWIYATPAASYPIFRDAAGNGRYMIVLKESVANAEPIGEEPPARSTMDPANATDIFGWHKPNVRALVKRLERAHGAKALAMTSHAMPAFSSYLSDRQLQLINADPAVETVYPIYDYGRTLSPWTNRYDGSELVPWGKPAIGTDDGLTTTNRVYLIDGGAQYHDDYQLIKTPIWTDTQYANEDPTHATHIAGILGAKANNSDVRGINPNMPVVNVNRGGPYEDHWESALDWVLIDAEQNGIYAVANFSTSSPDIGGLLAKYIRRISNRILFVQAAGNYLQDACGHAYNVTNADDGILVVGGTDEWGQQAISFDNTSVGGVVEPGSDYGPCVEAWAPSQRIFSTWPSTLTPTSLSGTSMAAPHVAALAARFGNTYTTPVERENYIRGVLASTGYSDSSGYPVKAPSYLQTSSIYIGSKLPIYAASADSTYSGSVANLIDGLYLNTPWNSGHSAPAWVELDLGSSKTVTRIRLTPEQSPEGAVIHQVYVGNSPNPPVLATTIAGNGAPLEPFAAVVNAYGRYVRVLTTSSPSWVAWREVEIYGY